MTHTKELGQAEDTAQIGWCRVVCRQQPESNALLLGSRRALVPAEFVRHRLAEERLVDQPVRSARSPDGGDGVQGTVETDDANQVLSVLGL